MITISGRVIKGQGLGRKLGYPTANIDRRQYARGRLKVKLGIWAGKVRIKDKRLKIRDYAAAVVIGPADRRGLPKIEAHLLGFWGNLYGRKISLTLKKYLRPFKKFKGEAALKAQIKRDIKLIKNLKYG